jgi:prepilin-type N-terminal cleavage/methylation domain-containing protein
MTLPVQGKPVNTCSACFSGDRGIRGFTLIELLVTIAIVGILAGIATTAYIGSMKKAARSEAYANLESLRLLEEQYFADRGEYTPPQGDPSLGTCAKNNPNNVDIIRSGGGDDNKALPGFRPGNDTSYSYCLEGGFDIDGAIAAGDPPCFRARAFGNDKTRVTDDEFAIDCNNERTF